MSHMALTPFSATKSLALRLQEGQGDYDALMAMVPGRRFVLLGESTHGTRDFYRMRADITRRLIAEEGFDGVAVEGDWPDTWRVNRFVQGETTDDAYAALTDFERFPSWMWRNEEMFQFIGWLRAYNADRPAARRVGIYGLDLYSLYRSADAVIRYLEEVDPVQAAVARERYAALDHVREPQTYGYQVAIGQRPPAHDEVVAQLLQLRARAQDYIEHDDLAAADAHFFAERNAAVVVQAEHYYRAMFGRRTNTWNLRDAHMRDTLLALSAYRHQRNGSGRIVVWAHNSHIGDARATEMHSRGEFNLGQILRQELGEQVLLVGFTTYAGYVSAASEWDGEVELKRVRPALPNSYERLFHTTSLDRFFLPLKGPQAEQLKEPLLERAIGVIYLPETERASHYFEASLAHQFDAVFHLDETEAVEPLIRPARWRSAPDMRPASVL
ncbi:erythromycin esterase family protein [Acidiferrobacter sp.]|uniref:erythromycin esterase family protein n=1 Tax=Acidiferrobacter sp. TaxID=1872107 RepID=UPI00260DBE2E|nr:erythromycin esterase family protein [Acidiferrobacter sp.]